MNRRDEKLLTRHLVGETSPEEGRDLAARLAREPELERELERRRAAWEGLALPPAGAAPPGFAAALAARLAPRAAESWLGPAPAWARLAAAAALVAGVVLGVQLAPPAEPAETESLLAGELGGDSLADAYLEALAAATPGEEGDAR